MVHTRSQPHEEEDVEDMFAELPTGSPSRKRKMRDIAESQSPAPKRSHMTLRSKTPGRITPALFQTRQRTLDDEPPRTLEAVRDGHEEISTAKERRRNLEMAASAAIRDSPTKAESLPSTDATIQGETSPTMTQFNREGRTAGTTDDDQESEKSLEIEEGIPPNRQPPNRHPPTAEKAQKRRKKATKATARTDIEQSDHPNGSAPHQASVAKSNPSSKPQSSQPSTHKRFDSEEPNAPSPAQAEPEAQKTTKLPPPPVAIEDDASDSDAAPEALTKSASAHRAHSTAADIAKALAQKATAEKHKRRARDEALKLQAQKSAKRASKRKRSSSSPEETPRPEKRLALGDPLPALLPDYLLQSRPGERELLPPPPALPTAKKSEGVRAKKLRFLEREERPPKDVRKEDITVRVLESRGKQNLPPRASVDGRRLREGWLSGKRKGGQVERRSWKAGFVRR